MKNNKWLTYTLGVLLTLVVLAVVAGISFRIGMTQNPSFIRPAFAQNFNGEPRFMQRNFPGNVGPQGMPNNFRGQSLGSRGFNRGGRMTFFAPIFGVIHFVVIGLVIVVLGWLAYLLVKKSGWRLTRAQETAAFDATPSVSETVDVATNKKKKSK